MVMNIFPTYTPAPLTDRVTALTPRGHAALSLYRFVQVLRDLDATDRAWILDMLREELVELPVTA